AWRFWTVPNAGGPLSESWQGKGIEHGGAPTWFTGTYDAASDTLYWPTGTPMLIDADWQGQPRKLLLHGNRNGFFYVFDRTDGKLLLAKPFVRNLTWASGIGADGRPIKNPNQEPTPQGTKVCPSQDGATNWFSPSYNPTT